MLTLPVSASRARGRCAALGAILRCAFGLFLHGLRRPFAPACITRDGRVMPR